MREDGVVPSGEADAVGAPEGQHAGAGLSLLAYVDVAALPEGDAAAAVGGMPAEYAQVGRSVDPAVVCRGDVYVASAQAGAPVGGR